MEQIMIQRRKSTSPQQLSQEEFAKQLDELIAFVESVRQPDAGTVPDEALTRESMYYMRNFARYAPEGTVAVDPTTLAQAAS